MQNKPVFHTAVPVRRYRLGDFNLVFLGDIESDGAPRYHYILAVLVDTDPEPGLYLTLEREEAGCRLRLIMRDGEEVLERWPDCGDLSAFVDHAMGLMRRLLGLESADALQLL